ncbi:enoyl-CoA hydratase-related protein [Zavarzinia sp. CC-PAN008]|uniref:enoyl-CoA hydratase-related protein n=1 Tax=Zavarzinia sp. CC-PAN008 TaxID=3243332 RepID=UPI003F742D5A
MSLETLVVETADAIRTIRLNRPQVLNALNARMWQELTDVLDETAADPEVRAVLLTGAGRAFCAGADLSTPPSAGDSRDPGDRSAESMHTLINPMVMKLATLPKPVVCAVNGVAAGGGVGLALACDVVVSARSATFIQVFGPQLGIVPDMGCSWFLPHLVGRQRALGLALLGDRLPAETAAEWGLIWKAVDDAALAEEAGAIARKLAAGPTIGFGLIKKAITAAANQDLAASLHLEAESQRIAFRTEDTKEGVLAFVQKRKANFKGR